MVCTGHCIPSRAASHLESQAAACLFFGSSRFASSKAVFAVSNSSSSKDATLRNQ